MSQRLPTRVYPGASLAMAVANAEISPESVELQSEQKGPAVKAGTGRQQSKGRNNPSTQGGEWIKMCTYSGTVFTQQCRRT